MQGFRCLYLDSLTARLLSRPDDVYGRYPSCRVVAAEKLTSRSFSDLGILSKLSSASQCHDVPKSHILWAHQVVHFGMIILFGVAGRCKEINVMKRQGITRSPLSPCGLYRLSLS